MRKAFVIRILCVELVGYKKPWLSETSCVMFKIFGTRNNTPIQMRTNELPSDEYEVFTKDEKITLYQALFKFALSVM